MLLVFYGRNHEHPVEFITDHVGVYELWGLIRDAAHESPADTFSISVFMGGAPMDPRTASRRAIEWLAGGSALVINKASKIPDKEGVDARIEVLGPEVKPISVYTPGKPRENYE